MVVVVCVYAKKMCVGLLSRPITRGCAGFKAIRTAREREREERTSLQSTDDYLCPIHLVASRAVSWWFVFGFGLMAMRWMGYGRWKLGRRCIFIFEWDCYIILRFSAHFTPYNERALIQEAKWWRSGRLVCCGCGKNGRRRFVIVRALILTEQLFSSTVCSTRYAFVRIDPEVDSIKGTQRQPADYDAL